jgi:hypothetical protein
MFFPFASYKLPLFEHGLWRNVSEISADFLAGGREVLDNSASKYEIHL